MMLSENRRSDFVFSDSQMQFNHDVRVWICGAEVTDHLRGSISLRRGDRNGPSTLQFDLDNVKDIFVITAANKGYNEEDGKYEKNPNTIPTDLTENLTKEAKGRIDKIYSEIENLEEELQKNENEYSDNYFKIQQKYEKDVNQAQLKLEKAAQTGNKREKEAQEKKLTDILPAQRDKEHQKCANTYEAKKQKIEQKLSVARKRKQQLIGNINREKDENGNYKYTTTDIGTFGTAAEAENEATKLSRYNYTGKKTKKGTLERDKRGTKDYTCKSDELIFKTNNGIFDDHLYSDSAKKLIYTNKVILNANIDIGGIIKDGGFGFKPYALTIDTPIIEKHDPIRIFIKDPCSPFIEDDGETTERSRWVPLFTGFIDTVTDHEDYLNGDKFLSVSCFDIRGIMQRMRVMTNPRISRGTDTARERAEQAKKFTVNTGYFTDFFAQGPMWGEKSTKYLHHAFDDVCLEFLTGRWYSYKDFADTYVGEVVSSQSNKIIDNKAMFDEINKRFVKDNLKADASLNGVGTFIPGVILEYPKYEGKDEDAMNNPEYKNKCIRTMELWYDLLVFGIKGTYYTADEIEHIGNSTLPYAEFDPYNCFVHMIKPPDGTQARWLFDSQLEDLQTGFIYESRFEVFSKLCEKIDYQWFTNSMGDIVVEFPMYDFTPDIFGAYESNLTVDNHLVSTALNEVAGNVVSAVSAAGSIQSITGGVQMGITPMCYTAFAKSDLLAYKYGINIEEYSAPHLRTDVSPAKLRNQAILELIKANVAVSSMEMEVSYRYAIFPNKPIKNVPKHRMATVTGFSYTMQVNESVSCTIDTAMVKKQNEDNTYISIFNAPNMPIKYIGTNAIDISHLQSGIDAFYVGADGKPASDVSTNK